MEIVIETERLIIRELLPTDAEGMFELDADPEVHLYLGNNPVKNIEQSRTVIQIIRQQYIDNGIGRWAVIEKSSGNFIGWSGLKLIKEPINDRIGYLDLGYRFIKKYWGKGYASETAKASLDYGFNELKQDAIYAIADVHNAKSRKVLEKSGLKFIETFNWDGVPHDWFEITKEEWEQQKI
jgi:[ribosomal protein S5]-alanine N-acetyltransferase